MSINTLTVSALHLLFCACFLRVSVSVVRVAVGSSAGESRTCFSRSVSLSSGFIQPRTLKGLSSLTRWRHVSQPCLSACVVQSVWASAANPAPGTQLELEILCAVLLIFRAVGKPEALFHPSRIRVSTATAYVAHGVYVCRLKLWFCWIIRGSVPFERCCRDCEGFSLAPPSLTGRSRVATGKKYAIPMHRVC